MSDIMSIQWFGNLNEDGQQDGLIPIFLDITFYRDIMLSLYLIVYLLFIHLLYLPI